MSRLLPRHGGTDSGPEPLHDFSSNANPLGPCPSILEAVRRADPTRYPDPSYNDLRRRLAEFHGVAPGRIVIGAGASELILRLVRHAPGTVNILGPTFSEYSRCAAVEDRLAIEAQCTDEFLYLQKTRNSTGFVCWPNNPTGTRWPLEFLSEAAATGRLVVDFAYAPLCPDGDLALAGSAATRAFQLHAPNKSFGFCGLRAAYLIAPRTCPSLEALAPSWVIDRAAEAFLSAAIQPEAQRWLARCRPQIAAWRSDLAGALTSIGIDVRQGPATFLMARIGRASCVTEALREQGLRVRDCSSFGLPEWIRISVQSPDARRLLVDRLASIVALLPTAKE